MAKTVMNTAFRPRCACCGKMLRPFTETVRAPRATAHAGWPVKDWKYPGNQRVMARRYADLAVSPDGARAIFINKNEWDRERAQEPQYTDWHQERRLDFVSVWDGDRYRYAAWPFCSNPCAIRFAEAAYKGGYRRMKPGTAP